MCFHHNLVLVVLNVMLNGDKHCSDVCCDEFPVPQTDRKSKAVKGHGDTKNYLQFVW